MLQGAASALPGAADGSRSPTPGDIGLVAVAFLGGFSIWPAYVALGSLFGTLNSQFGWSRSQVTTAQLIYAVASVATAPVIGPLIDRVGSRRLLLTGLVLVPLALVMIGSAGQSYPYWIGAWIVASFTGQLIAPPVWASGVARRFEHRRGLALGLAACGIAAASAVTPMIMVQLIALDAWRGLYYGMAAFLILILLPLTLLFYRDGGKPPAPHAVPVLHQKKPGKDMFRREVLSSGRFWQLSAVVFLVAFVVGGMLIHMQPLFRARGLSAISAASTLAFYGIGGIAGRLIGGWLLDRFHTGPLSALPMCVCPVAASLIVIFSGGSDVAPYALVALLIGISAGVEVDVIPYLARRYFPDALFGRTYLALAAVFVIGAGTAPFLVGLSYDATRAYNGFLVASVVMGSLAAVALLLLGAYPASVSRQE